MQQCSDVPGTSDGHIRAGNKMLCEVPPSFVMPVSILYIFGD